jgi:soluble lytic murein transglycosylase-like protein
LIRPILISLALLAGSAAPAHAVDPCAKLQKHFKKYGLPVKEFTYIAKRESGCNPKAINARFNKKGDVIWTLNKNGSIDRGLLQINSAHKETVRTLCKGRT